MTLCIVALILIGCTNNINWGGHHWRSVLQADAKGYYAYLPAVFIERDLSFDFLEKAETLGSNPNLHYDYRVAPEGHVVNKYWCGTALLQAPFFLVAHTLLKISGGSADGYGKPYVMALCLAAIAYSMVGLWALMAVLDTYAIPKYMQAVVAVVLMFGTHLFYYTIVAPGMSHVYSFALVALFFLAGRRYFLIPNTRLLLVMGVLLGLIVLVRPVNGLVVLVLFFLADTSQGLVAGTKSSRRFGPALLGSLVLASTIAGIQPLIYFFGTGFWWFDSYPGEQFNWAEPHILDILFSYKKGLSFTLPFAWSRSWASCTSSVARVSRSLPGPFSCYS